MLLVMLKVWKVPESAICSSAWRPAARCQLTMARTHARTLHYCRRYVCSGDALFHLFSHRISRAALRIKITNLSIDFLHVIAVHLPHIDYRPIIKLFRGSSSCGRTCIGITFPGCHCMQPIVDLCHSQPSCLALSSIHHIAQIVNDASLVITKVSVVRFAVCTCPHLS
jgi:hypothetical protein